MQTNRNSLFIKLVLFSFVLTLVIACSKANDPVSGATVTDVDGNVYKTVVIGTQTWMAENLRTTRYRDSTLITNLPDTTKWAALTTGARCKYFSKSVPTDTLKYGYLYNWYAASNVHNIAPKGWHVPSDAEWTKLTNYLGGAIAAGGKLKDSSLLYWLSPNTGATNETGFTALPGGCLSAGTFSLKGTMGFCWSSTSASTTTAMIRYLNYSAGSLATGGIGFLKANGYSIRCVKDSI